MNLTWRDVFDTNHMWQKHITDGAALAKSTGYPYFCWNGEIYETHTGLLIQGITTEDVSRNQVPIPGERKNMSPEFKAQMSRIADSIAYEDEMKVLRLRELQIAAKASNSK